MIYTIKIITDLPIDTETIKHIFNEVDNIILKTEEDYTFSISKKPKSAPSQVATNK